MDGRTDRQTAGRTGTPPYRDPKTHPEMNIREYKEIQYCQLTADLPFSDPMSPAILDVVSIFVVVIFVIVVVVVVVVVVVQQ